MLLYETEETKIFTLPDKEALKISAVVRENGRLSARKSIIILVSKKIIFNFYTF